MQYLRAIFIGFNKTLGGIAIQLWYNGRSKLVLTDDFLPCVPVKPSSFTENGVDSVMLPIHHTRGNDLWLPLLEKCLAKHYGSYRRLRGGSYAEIMRDLTGEVIVTHEISSYSSEERKQLIETIFARYQMGMVLLGCLFHDVTDEEKNFRDREIAVRKEIKKELQNSTLELLGRIERIQTASQEVAEQKLVLSAKLKRAVQDREDSLALLTRSKTDPEKSEHHQSLIQVVKATAAKIADCTKQLQEFEAQKEKETSDINKNDQKVSVLENEISAFQAELTAYGDGREDVTLVIEEIVRAELDSTEKRHREKYFILVKSPCPCRLRAFLDTCRRNQEFTSMDHWTSEIEEQNEILNPLLSQWVPWELFHVLFSKLYITHLSISSMPPKWTPGFTVDTLCDSWTEGTAGGGIACVGWRTNPMYRLFLTNRPEKTLWRVRINLSLEDKRKGRNEEEDSLAVRIKYEPFALTVLADDPLLSEVNQ